MVVERWRWGVVWLLFAATLVNYMDRQALANAQRYLLPEFEPDPARQNEVYASVQFAFGLSFALFQVVAGFLIDRFSLRWLYLGAILVWSAAGVATGFVPAGAVGLLMACRVTLGVGEAFNWPCAVAAVRRLIPRESVRGRRLRQHRDGHRLADALRRRRRTRLRLGRGVALVHPR
jgi:ACS family hexuronate transporter-like MFS transporter